MSSSSLWNSGAAPEGEYFRKLSPGFRHFRARGRNAPFFFSAWAGNNGGVNAPNAAKEITLKTDRGEIRAKVWGPPEGMKVLALHGWLDNSASFDPLLPLLPASWQVVAIDLPGHGFSTHRGPGQAYHFIDWIGDVESVLEALKWEKAALIGHSLGGGIAAIFAGTFPDRVTKLVLLESLGPLSNEAEGMPQRLEHHLAERRRLAVKGPPKYATLDEVVHLRRMVGSLAERSARRLVERGMKPAAEGVTWRSDPKLRLPSPMRLTLQQVQSFLKRIACPTLVIRAEQGMPIEEAEVRAREGCWRDLKVERVQGHHHVHMDHPERIAPALITFLGEAP